jgi:hypothetical protein
MRIRKFPYAQKTWSNRVNQQSSNVHAVGRLVCTDIVDDADEPRVTVSSRVPPDLAREVARLADLGNRTVSREVAQAIREHVAQELGRSSVED